MYCSKCGKKAHYDDIFCSRCGNRLERDEDDFFGEEIIFNSSQERKENFSFDNHKEQDFEEEYKHLFKSEEPEIKTNEASDVPEHKIKMDNSEFVWDIHDFEHHEKKREDIVVDWKRLQVYDPDEDVSEESAPQIEEEATPIIPLEKDSVELEEESFDEPEDVEVTIEDIQKDIDGEIHETSEARRDTARIDKFYTFNQKNEEFQKLLDREYERVNKGRTEEAEEEDWSNLGVFNPEEHLRKAAAERGEEAYVSDNTALLEEVKQETEPSKKETAVEEDLFGMEDVMDNATIIKKFDTKELEKDLLEIEIEKEKAARAKLEAAASTKVILQSEVTETVQNVPEEKPSQEEPFEGKTIAIGADEFTKETNRLLDELYGDKEAKKKNDFFKTMESPLTETFVEESTEKVEFKSVTEDEKAEAFEEIEEAAETETIEVIAETESGTEAEDTEEAEATTEAEEIEEKPGKRKITKVIITLAIIILIFEFAILGIKHFAPESAAAEAIDNALVSVMEIFEKDKGDGEGEESSSGESDSTLDESQNSDGQAGSSVEENAAPVVSAEPLSVDELLVNTYAVNKNIKSITADSSLGYSAQTSYDHKDMDKTVALENNLWYTKEDGMPVYLDQSIVDTLVAFDSQWIDYVNTKDESVFYLLKTGSDAYKNCKDFTKAGKVTKQFKSLVFGEIRASETGYYIWAKEEIETTENGKTNLSTFKWVYYMEPVDKEMKIVDYFRF